MVMLLFFLSNNLFFFHLLGNFLYVVCCILWETVADDVILDFLCAYLLKTEDIHPPKTGISVHFSGSLV